MPSFASVPPRRLLSSWAAGALVAILLLGCAREGGRPSGSSASPSIRARALELLREGEPRKALDLLEKGRRKGDPDEAFLLGEAALRCGSYGKAASAYREVLAARPENLPASIRLARIAFLEAHYEEALKQLDWILARSPDAVEARSLRSRIRLRLGDLNGAAVDARRWSQLAPKDAEPLSVLGTIQILRGDVEGAVLVLQRAVEMDPTHLPSRLELAKAYRRAGRTRLAQETLQEAGRLEREQRKADQQRAEASYHRMRAQELMEAGKAKDALRSYQDALSHDPRNPDLLRAAGEAALASGSHEQALEYLDSALPLAPSDAGIRRVRGEALLASGDTEGALKDLQEAARLDPTDPAPHRALSRAYQTLHRPEAEKELALAEQLEREASPEGIEEMR
jgi:tetratricopeptide (TPR) repeat protein